MFVSVVIPTHNEEDNIGQVVGGIRGVLERENIGYEIIIVEDNSSDATPAIINSLAQSYPSVKVVRRLPPRGFGRAVRDGLMNVRGDVAAIMMGDFSDDPEDLVRCLRKIEEGYDCVFGSRFIKGSKVKDYPPLKLFVNRMANIFIKLLFSVRANDITNAFKVYRMDVIRAIQPIQAAYFNITVELPLKAVVRGFSFVQIPISWYGRKSGVSKLGIKEMGRKYLFTVLYIWLEKILMADEIALKKNN